MLKSLYIKNFAIIDEITIDFSKGFNVFTGETGAGKSIIIGALSLLSKGRNDISLIKSGQDKAIIEGIFSIDEDDYFLKKQLDEAEIEYDHELIVRRVISNTNSSIRINNSAVTLSFLTNLLSPIVDIHSQKDSQYLFNKKNHEELLDKYAKDDKEVKEYKEVYCKYIDLKKEYDSLINEKYNESDLEFFKFQLNEISEANLTEDEENELEDKEKRYKLKETFLTSLSKAEDLYNGNDGIKEKIQSLLKTLDLDDNNICDIKTKIESIYYDLEDNISSLSNIFDSYNDENIDINFIEERMFLYSKLKRKYNMSVKDINEYKNELINKINLFSDREYIVSEKEKALNLAKEECLLKGEELSKIRRNASISLKNDIENECRELLLNDITFEVKILNNEITDNGIDDIEFYVSMNKGEELKPLKNVASGGETSRIMLALKIIFSKLSNTKLIIFDEIDTGVSGKAALCIGNKISLISKDIQVISITHLALVAAHANQHFYIYKKEENGITNTHVRELYNDDVYKELAIMSTGSINEESIETARQLYLKVNNDN